ncbi:MAG: PQQ-dependent sugar dehydrogenase [Bacteroidetes bacterium]|nr:PQQ-dependent sugar dehydrogenase [Bacteroidota bacterium]
MLYKNVKATYFTALVLFFLITKCYGQGSPVLTPLFSDNLVSSGWNQVVGFQYDSLGRMYVWEKSGKVWFVDANGVKSTTPVINLSDEVGNWRDHGLNGFALDPNFNTNGLLIIMH